MSVTQLGPEQLTQPESPTLAADETAPYGVMDVVNLVINSFKFGRGEVGTQDSALAYLVATRGERLTAEVIEAAKQSTYEAAHYTYTNPRMKIKSHAVASGKADELGEVRTVEERVDTEVARAFNMLTEYLFEKPELTHDAACKLPAQLLLADYRWLPVVRHGQGRPPLGKPFISNVVRYGLLEEKPKLPEYAEMFALAGKSLLQMEGLQDQFVEVIKEHSSHNKRDKEALTKRLAGTELEVGGYAMTRAARVPVTPELYY